MSIKEEMKALVQLQARERQLLEIDTELAEVACAREAARAEISAAEAVVTKAQKDAEEARHEAKRLDLELKTAEEKVAKYKDQMHNVKTNEQLWAIQEEIGHAQKGVDRVETRILEQLEIADSRDEVIAEKKAELIGEKKRIDALVAEADRREEELKATRRTIESSVSELAGQVPEALMKKYEGIKRLRGGVGVAEVLDEYCLVCNTKVRPQFYVEAHNFNEIMQCENCKRIIFVAEPLGLGPAPAPAADESATGGAASALPDATASALPDATASALPEDAGSGSPDAADEDAKDGDPAPPAGGISALGAAPVDIAS